LELTAKERFRSREEGTAMEVVERSRQDLAEEHVEEVRHGKRFEFGDNWSKFLRNLNEDQIVSAETSLRDMLEVSDLAGKKFLDAGSGSGLFSLAARRLGAQVHSFDYDPQSVACTKELRKRYFQHDPWWQIDHQSVLDEEYLSSLGRFDVVYSWGVLHHTGAMWRALDHVHRSVAHGGLLFIAIYNDTGTQSARWRRIKQLYNALPRPFRWPYTVAVATPVEIKAMLSALAYGHPSRYLKRWTEKNERGMSHWRDWVDWIGGYPYEVAKPERIFEFYKSRGFSLSRLKSTVGLGCNEFVFKKQRDAG
jgi:2-polyprenyl-6-hydroxyphenyl methylase/3-demethylubiquinone-9 3-methyltransferase